MRIVLDTNAYSDWRRHGRWNPLISTAEDVLVPGIVLGELRYGFRKAALGAENEVKLSRFLSHARVQVLPVDEATSRIYADLKHYLHAAGKPIPENDIWISSLAVQAGALLVSADAHFDFLPQVAKAVE